MSKQQIMLKNSEQSMTKDEECIAQLIKERDQLANKLEIAKGALRHYQYGGSNYSKVARDALEQINNA